MKKRASMLKGIVVGALSTVLLSGTLVMANPVTRDLFFGVNVTLNGTVLDFEEDSQPFIIDGRTFLPVGALADVLDVTATWEGETSTVHLATQPTPPEPYAPVNDPILPVDPSTDLPAEPIAAEINPITPAEIAALQAAWGEGLVAISTAFAEGEDYAAIAQNVLDTLYGYVDGTVLFKPTIASEVPFRFTETGAASYFIGASIGDAAYEEDGQGFATSPWTAVRFGADGAYIINGETALWMGSVFLTNDEGEEIRVEKSLGLYRDANGDVRIQLHHSSVPFAE